MLSFIAIRLAVSIAGSAESEFAQAAKAGGLPEAQFYIGSNIILFGYHIHHFYFGILLICIATWLAIVGTKIFSTDHIALMYGAGLGLFLDEIGPLLTWGDYYSSLSYTISLFVLALFLNILFFGPFWSSLKTQFGKDKKSPFAKALKKKHSPIHFIDVVTQKFVSQEHISKAFSATLYIALAIIILIVPQTVQYWVAGAFIVQGTHQLIKTTQGETTHDPV